MKFEKHFPTNQLKPYIQYYVVSENELASEYKVFPTSGLVMGFQYQGQLTCIEGPQENKLSSAGISGISNGYKIFKNSANIGTILVYFSEIGFRQFAAQPAHELFNLSISLEDIFDSQDVREVEEQLSLASSDLNRIQTVELFLLSQLKDIEQDKLIMEAVRLIYQSKGNIRIQELNKKLGISASPFEKRFRQLVGTSAKKFASIIRFNSVLDSLEESKSLTEICYENHFFDQAHFIKDFKQFTGDTPEHFKRFS
ncbi:helix-turn-helix domain-containing protein [Aquirufa ecclesiirivi]|uniref:helix-turn-helix domain-containing protein n=1 Tax=Aquirufa ecclesiirivi TaxID=2715124 RepID=UPI00140DDFD8|nr:helix-turn-helix domain-containing protein [Aquirufa ecclesiirivi]NHC50176.1 AraC family transcriptional regulator [Aquirufa ecclesiirivi]